MYVIKDIVDCIDALEELAVQGENEGYKFVRRTINEWLNGSNSFDKPGEFYLGIYDEDKLIGIGGLNQDPYTDEHIGRVRHVFIHQDYRRQGLATNLVKEIIKRGQKDFSTFRLSTNNINAGKMYEMIGFKVKNEDKCTHYLMLEDKNND